MRWRRSPLRCGSGSAICKMPEPWTCFFIPVAHWSDGTPTADEHSFLRIVTRGYPELEAQVESCEVSAYDPAGYCDVRVGSGPPFRRERFRGHSVWFA